MKVVIFDTETTGLPKMSLSKTPQIEDSLKYPHIVQFSYVVFDTSNNTIIKIYDKVIGIPADIEISKESIALHHITREIIDAQGIQIEEALLEFLTDFAEADMVVGHNIQFDNNMVIMELRRNIHIFEEELIAHYQTSDKFYCTMKNSIELCAIKVCYKNSTKTYNKFPKLVELYAFLFRQTPTKLHNSLNDVIICLRCFCKIYLSIDITETSPDIAQMCNDIM